MTVIIRNAMPSDYVPAGEATAKAYAPFLNADSLGQHEYLQVVADLAARADTQVLFVAEYDSKLIGSVSLALNTRQEVAPGASHVRMLGVAPEYEGLGAGRALLQACVDRSRDEGKTTIGLRTTAPMVRAQRLYESAGFRRFPPEDYDDERWGTFLAYRLDL